jgi:hypothetical protein
VAKNDSTPTSSGYAGASQDVSLLREQRMQADQSGDTARVADLDRQIREAEQSQGGTAQK